MGECFGWPLTIFSVPFEFLASPTLHHSWFIFMYVYRGGLRFTARRRLYSDLKHLLNKNLHFFLVLKGCFFFKNQCCQAIKEKILNLNEIVGKSY